MRARILLGVSLVVNAAVLIAVLVSFRSPSSIPRVVRPVDRLLVASNNTIRVVKTNILVRPITVNLTWQDVESEDYVAYIANLRAIGCPEETIRDIIVADVNQLFSKKRAEDAAVQDLEWWRAEPSRELQRGLIDRAAELERQRQSLLTELLGPKWNAAPPEQNVDAVPLGGPVLSALPAETKQAVQEISARSRERQRAYAAERESSGQPVSAAEMARLRDKTRTELAAVLTPAQLEEFLLRHSANATQLRQEWKGLSPTPEEFRTVFRATDALDRELALLAGADDAVSVGKRSELERLRQAALKNILSGERFEAYQTSRQPGYQEAQELARQNGASPQAGVALFEIKQAVAVEQERIRNDATLTEAQKAAELRAVEEQQQKANAQLLGLEPPVPNPSPVEPRQTHVFVAGDNLMRIALTYGVGIIMIRQANPDVDFRQLRVGQPLVIPSRVR